MSMTRTFCLLKPDALRRGLVDAILGRLELDGLAVVRSRTLVPGPVLAAEHYREHREWEGFADLVAFTCSGEAMALVLASDDPARPAVPLLREVMGPYRERIPGTIRGDWMAEGSPLRENLIHGSDSDEAARREIGLWFDGESFE